MAKDITMEDIAAKLKISKSLVSKALSDKYGVSDEMRDTIKLTAINMGYKFKAKQRAYLSKTESITLIVEKNNLLDSGFWLKHH